MLKQSVYEIQKKMIENNDDNILAFLNDKECLICMNEFTSGEKIMFCPFSFKHYFHSSCFLNWLKNSKSCPKCNTAISVEYITSRKEEYNINVIEKNILNDQSLHRKPNALNEGLNERRVSIILATKEDSERVTSVITNENKKSLEPFAYGEIQEKSL